MRNKQLLSLCLAAMMAISVASTAFANNVRYDDGGTHVESTDINNTDSGKAAVYVSDSSSVTVNGDVTSASTGAFAEKDSDITINGSVAADNTGALAVSGSGITVNGDVSSANSNAVGAAQSSEVDVRGNVTSDTGVGVHADQGSVVSVIGDITSEKNGIEAVDNAIVEMSGNITSGENGNSIMANGGSDVYVDGDVESTSSRYSAVAADNHSTVQIEGNVTNSNLSLTNDRYTNTLLVQNESNVIVGGNVVSTEYGASVSGGSSIFIDGDVTSETRNLYVRGDSSALIRGDVVSKTEVGLVVDNTSEVRIEGDIKGKQAIEIRETGNNDGSVIVLGSVSTTDGKQLAIHVSGEALSNKEVIDQLPTIIVGELDKEDTVRYHNNNPSSTVNTEQAAKEIAEQILFFIDVIENPHGKTSVQGVQNVKGFDVAKAGDHITVSVTAENGYEITGLSGGKAGVSKNGDGSWSITVPKTGGVAIEALIKAVSIVNNSTTSPESGSNSGDTTGQNSNTPSSQNATQNASKQGSSLGTITISLSDGSTLSLEGVKTAGDQSSTGLVSENGVTVVAADQNTSWIDAATAAQVQSIDSGVIPSLPNCSDDLTGKKVAGGSIAVSLSQADKALSVYASGIPAGSAPAVLYYDSVEKTWKLLTASYDAANGMITFTAHTSGIAVVVY